MKVATQLLAVKSVASGPMEWLERNLLACGTVTVFHSTQTDSLRYATGHGQPVRLSLRYFLPHNPEQCKALLFVSRS